MNLYRCVIPPGENVETRFLVFPADGCFVGKEENPLLSTCLSVKFNPSSCSHLEMCIFAGCCTKGIKDERSFVTLKPP